MLITDTNKTETTLITLKMEGQKTFIDQDKIRDQGFKYLSVLMNGKAYFKRLITT